MLLQKEVEVISITRAIESETGDYIFQVTFGHVIDIDADLRRSIPTPANSKPPKKIAPTTFSIFIHSDSPLPYRVGSKWKLLVNDSGSIRISALR